MAVAKLNAALILRLDGIRQTIAAAPAVCGPVVPAAFLDAGVAERLRGKPFNGSTLEEFAAACSGLVSRSIPDRASLSCKQHAVRGLARDHWAGIEARPDA